MAITGASLQPIYDRLNGISKYHPMSADAFTDWSMEAGDIVTMSRDGDSFESPVHSMHIAWRGSPVITLNSNGNEERESISKISRRKYGRGGAGMANNQALYSELYSEDGRLHSALEYSESRLIVTFSEGIDNTRADMMSALEMTASHLQVAFEAGIDDTRADLTSALEMTASHLETEFTDNVNSLRSEVEVTASQLRTEFTDDVNSLRGEMEVTASHLRTEFTDDVNSLRSEVEVTASQLRTEFENTASSLRSSITQQANRIGLVVEGTGANAHIKAAQIVAAINDDGTSETIISADKVKISGTTTINDVFTVTDGHVATKVSIYAMPGTAFNGNHVGSFYYSQQEGDYSVQYGVLKKAEVDGNNLKIWKFGDADSSPSINFSKATALSGAVGSGSDGNKYIVTASPQGVNHAATVSIEIDGAVNPNATVYAKAYVVSPSVSKTQIGSATEMTLGESTSGKYVELYTGSGSSKIQKGKISTAATYNAGWTYGQTQIVRTTRAATSQETTIKTLDYSERFAIIDTYTKPNGTTSEIKYIVEGKADRYSAGQNSVAINKGSWSGGQVQFTKSAGTASTKGVRVGLSGSWANGVYSYTINDYYDNSQGVSTGYSSTISAPGVTVSAGTWSNGSTTVTAKHGTKQLGSTTVTIPAVTVSAGTWTNGTVTVSATHGTHTAGTNVISAPTMSVEFDCDDLVNPSYSEGNKNDNALRATVKHGTASKGTGSQIIHMRLGSWSSGHIAINCRLANDNGKLLDRIWLDAPSPSLGSNTTTKPSGTLLKTVTVGSGSNHTYFTISVGGTVKGYVDVKY